VKFGRHFVGQQYNKLLGAISARTKQDNYRRKFQRCRQNAVFKNIGLCNTPLTFGVWKWRVDSMHS
jgi:hypothetical protein